MPKTYLDDFTCPKCKYKGTILRRTSSAGKIVSSYCVNCHKMVKVLAGAAPKKEGQ